MEKLNVIEYFINKVPELLGVDPVYGEVVKIIEEKERAGLKEFSHEYFLEKYGPEKCYKERAKLSMPYSIPIDQIKKYEYLLDVAEYALMYNRRKEHEERSNFTQNRVLELEDSLKETDILVARRARW